MDPLSLAVAVIASLLGAARMVMVIRVRLNARAFLTVLEKLIKADNVARAIKLCSAAPKAVVAAAARAGLLVSGDKGDGLELRRVRVVEAYTTELSSRMTAVNRGALLGWGAAALGVTAIGLGLTADPLTPLAAGLGGVAIVNALFAWWAFGRLRLDARVVGDGLVEALLATWMDSDDSDADPDRARKEAAKIGATLGLATPPPARSAATPSIGSSPKLADLRHGSCALCDGDDIGEAPDPARAGFLLFTCRSCGYSQLFADDPASV